MNIEKGENYTFEYYDESVIQELLAQGWQIDADGLDEEDTIQITQMMDTEYKLFQREDGLCTILVKETNAIEEMTNDELGQNPESVKQNMNQEYHDRLPEILGDYNKQSR